MFRTPKIKLTRKNPSLNLAVLTSGGDAPGMNAAIRSVVRICLNHQIRIFGVQRGYQGLIEGDLRPLMRSSVANILQRGGTALKTSRCPDFMKKSGRKKAANQLHAKKIDGLIVIGGDGSFRGAHALQNDFNIPTMGIPGTIDNDIPNTDDSIGFDTAVNTGLEAIDRIRDTATSHDRIFLVEVMGRHHGFIALEVGVAGGAERVFIPERKTPLKELFASIQRSIIRGKKSSIIVVAEGAFSNGAQSLATLLHKEGYEARICILGHTQRGGRPTAHDRYLAAHMGAAAVAYLTQRKSNGMVSVKKSEIQFCSFKSCLNKKKAFDPTQLELVKALAT